jgi:uncharacterized protein with HEPN domain
MTASIARIRAAEDALDAAIRTGDELAAALALDAILYRLLVVGEAVKALPDTMRETEPEVPWCDITRLHDLLAHHYHRVDLAIIRATCDQPLAELEAAAGRLRDGTG